MENILNWWLEYQKISPEELSILQKIRDDNIIKSSDYANLEDEYFSRMPFCNVSSKTHHITFDLCATDLIKKIFKKEVDDETLVVYSEYEHPAPLDEIKKCKNTYVLSNYNNLYTLGVSDIISEAKKYKKVFVYIIGTQISTGEITPQEFFIKLKSELIRNNIEHKIAIDDVHGMFLIPRDYSLFDYVISTAHALVRGYDMGILISKEYFGDCIYNWGKDYIGLLDIILKRKDKLNIFRTIMTEYFSDYLALNNFELFNRTCNHIFSLKTKGLHFTNSMIEELKKYEIWLEDLRYDSYAFRFRGQQYIKNPELCIEGIKKMRNIIDLSMG